MATRFCPAPTPPMVNLVYALDIILHALPMHLTAAHGMWLGARAVPGANEAALKAEAGMLSMFGSDRFADRSS